MQQVHSPYRLVLKCLRERALLWRKRYRYESSPPICPLGCLHLLDLERNFAYNRKTRTSTPMLLTIIEY